MYGRYFIVLQGKLNRGLFYGNGLSQIPRLINMAAPFDRDVIGQKLQGDHRQDGGEASVTP